MPQKVNIVTSSELISWVSQHFNVGWNKACNIIYDMYPLDGNGTKEFYKGEVDWDDTIAEIVDRFCEENKIEGFLFTRSD